MRKNISDSSKLQKCLKTRDIVQKMSLRGRGPEGSFSDPLKTTYQKDKLDAVKRMSSRKFKDSIYGCEQTLNHLSFKKRFKGLTSEKMLIINLDIDSKQCQVHKGTHFGTNIIF